MSSLSWYEFSEVLAQVTWRREAAGLMESLRFCIYKPGSSEKFSLAKAISAGFYSSCWPCFTCLQFYLSFSRSRLGPCTLDKTDNVLPLHCRTMGRSLPRTALSVSKIDY